MKKRTLLLSMALALVVSGCGTNYIQVYKPYAPRPKEEISRLEKLNVKFFTDENETTVNKHQLELKLEKRFWSKFKRDSHGIYLADLVYYAPTKAEIEEYINDYDSNLKFKDYKSDCDDFAIVFKAYLIQRITKDEDHKYPIAAGAIFGHMPMGHALNWIYCRDGNIYFYEPQTKKLFLPNDEIIIKIELIFG